MKKIINGKKYDTETATMIGEATANCPRNDFNFWEETLYRKNTGEYFIYGEGGPMTEYREYIDSNSWTGGSEFKPITENEARKWAEKYMSADEYEKEFGEVQE